MTACANAMRAIASATFSGSAASSAPGRPVFTLQKAQALVQVSPMIMKVACFFDQHSPILGQPASSHTVTRPFSRTIALVSLKTAEPGARTLIQSGLRRIGVSGLCAFSGWRGRAFSVSTTLTIVLNQALRPRTILMAVSRITAPTTATSRLPQNQPLNI